MPPRSRLLLMRVAGHALDNGRVSLGRGVAIKSVRREALTELLQLGSSRPIVSMRESIHRFRERGGWR